MPTSQEILSLLHETTAQSIRYAVGRIIWPPDIALPCVQIYHPDGEREMLQAPCPFIAGGISLTTETKAQQGVITLATTLRMVASIEQPEDTAALRAPAWMATLEELAPDVIETFEQDRRQAGGYVLLMQTPEWEFAVRVMEASGEMEVLGVRPRQWPAPPASNDGFDVL